MKYLFTLFCILIISGCMTLSTTKRTYTTDKWQVVARESSVEVHVKPETDEESSFQIYYVRVVNKGRKDQCVYPEWRLNDLQNHSIHSFQLIPKRSLITIGKLTYSPFQFDNLIIALPPSGYVNKMHLKDPIEGTCF